MISALLSKLYGIILEKKINIWLESQGKRAKVHPDFRSYHSTVNHIVMLKIIAKEYCNNKTNLPFFFVNFKEYFDTIHINNLWNRLEEIKVPFELRDTTIRLYENFIAKFKNTKDWSEDTNCKIGVKQGCSLSPTLFNIYFDKLKCCLEKTNCTSTTSWGLHLGNLWHSTYECAILKNIPNFTRY